MRRLRGRRLHRESDLGDGDCDNYGCSWPPSLPDSQPAPAPAPQRSLPSPPEPCPPHVAPAPAPVRHAAGGRRDQGRVDRYGSPPGITTGGGGDDHHRRMVTYALIAVAAFAFVSLILLGVSVAVRRRQVRRRRRQALLAAPAPAAPTDAGDDPEGGGGGGVVHHVWYIRTVGLDEAAIHSIAATRYRAGAGLLGAADCTVCLGEFQDGELVRLLPKCGHAFHVPCIDTWLRAHVNCPLCRSDVLDPAITTETGDGGDSRSTPPADPVEDPDAATAEQADAMSDAMTEQEQEDNDHPQVSLAEEEQHEQSSLPDQLPQPPCPMPRNVRRAASMDAAIVSTALDRLPEAAPEEEQSGRPKHDTGPPCAKASGSVGIPRLFFSRHCRARSSVLPL